MKREVFFDKVYALWMGKNIGGTLGGPLEGRMELLDIKGRKLSASEEKYICSWIDMGFNDELISLAYDRTVFNTGGRKWSYMDKILMSWKEKGLFTVRDVEEKDSPSISKALAYIQEHYAERLTLDDIADVRCFQFTGITGTQMVINQVSELVTFQKCFDISRFAIAYNE